MWRKHILPPCRSDKGMPQKWTKRKTNTLRSYHFAMTSYNGLHLERVKKSHLLKLMVSHCSRSHSGVSYLGISLPTIVILWRYNNTYITNQPTTSIQKIIILTSFSKPLLVSTNLSTTKTLKQNTCEFFLSQAHWSNSPSGCRDFWPCMMLRWVGHAHNNGNVSMWHLGSG